MSTGLAVLAAVADEEQTEEATVDAMVNDGDPFPVAAAGGEAVGGEGGWSANAAAESRFILRLSLSSRQQT